MCGGGGGLETLSLEENGFVALDPKGSSFCYGIGVWGCKLEFHSLIQQPLRVAGELV